MNPAILTRSRASLARRVLAIAGWLSLAGGAVAGIAYGPELYGLVELGKQIDAIALEDAGKAGRWPRAADACVACHGFDGNARAQTYPRLARQPEAYLKKQLLAFASGERSDPVMTPLALSMSEKELGVYAAHFARMRPVANATFKGDPAAVIRGAALAATHNCASCHGAQLQGQGEFPRLAGQGADYLRDQLAHFRDGTRHDAVMRTIANALAPQDIDDLAQYLASR